MDGEYLLVMQGAGSNPANYKFRLLTSEFAVVPLTLNQPVNGAISEPGETDTYTFEGEVGQQLFLDALSNNRFLKVQLIAPSGITVWEHTNTTDKGAFNLSETGSYHLVIEGIGDATDNYSFILSDRAQATELPIGAAVIGNLTPGNRVNLFQFTGTSGQRLKFDLNAASWSGANWVLYDPSGVAVKTPSSSSPDFIATVGADGIYTLAIAGGSATPVNYGFQVTDLSVTSVVNAGLDVVKVELWQQVR